MQNHRDAHRRPVASDLGKAAFGAMIVPRHVLGGPGHVPPSDRVNIAVIGAGGMGAENASQLVVAGQNLVALADVDFPHVDRTVAGRLRDQNGNPNPSGVALQEAYGKARRYDDYRRMLERERRNIDAVLIATPDHSHAPAASLAMRLGKHVYVQKPLTYSVREARVLMDLARRTGVVTQMGNQGRSMDDVRRVREWVEAGVIGPVREVHVWTNRPIWPQGVPRPDRALGRPRDAQWSQAGIRSMISGAMGGVHPIPEGVNWDLFLGPAPDVEYHPIYHPFNWRGWLDWGVGALGDMGAHLIDPPYWVLGLRYPTTIQATSTPWGLDREGRPASYPQSMLVHYEFPARGSQPPVKLTWYDGGLLPPRPEGLPDEVRLDRDRSGGAYLVGDRGLIVHEIFGNNPRVYPQARMEEAERVPQKYPRVGTTHEMNWIRAIRGEVQPTSPFDYAAPLTETMLLGLVALRTGQGRKIHFDGARMRITNAPEANQYLHREYRRGWTL